MEQLQIINQQEVLGKDFKIYGTKENPLFLAKDICAWLEMDVSNASKLTKNLDKEEYLTTRYNNTSATFITEDGLYEVLMQSRKPIAKQFKKEVKKILKQIRQTGGYIPTNEEDDDETIMAKALLIANKTIEKHKEIIANQKKQLEEQKPMVEFVNTITESSDSIDISQLAKLVKDENIKLGRNRLFQWLRDNKYLMKNNEPYQRYIEQGIFEYKEYTYNTPYKSNCIGHKTLVTGKGQVYIVEKLRKLF